VRLVAVLLCLLVSTVHAAKPTLKLPYTSGESWTLTRAYNVETHTGNDYYALDLTQGLCHSWNKPIRAMAPGTVETQTYSPNGYGNHLLINHGDGYKTRYAHLNSVAVENGASVVQGQIIGYCGNTGNVSGKACRAHPGTHVHVVLYHNGAAENMEPLSGHSDLNSKVGQGFVSDNVYNPPPPPPPNYACEWETQSPFAVTVSPGETRTFSVTYWNRGSTAWKGAGYTLSDPNYVELRSCDSTGTVENGWLYPGTGSGLWISQQRVTTATQTTIAADQKATFIFTVKVPTGQSAGTKRAYFRPYHATGGLIENWDGLYVLVDVVAPPSPVAMALLLRDPTTGRWWSRVSSGTAFLYPEGPSTPDDLWLNGWAAEGEYTFTPYTGDLDGDGYKDLIVQRNDANWYVAWNNRNGSFTDQGPPVLAPWGTDPSPGKYFFWFVNVNGDAKEELLTRDASNGNWYVCTFNTTTNTFDSCSQWLTWGSGIGTFQPLVGDWNGDGKADLNRPGIAGDSNP